MYDRLLIAHPDEEGRVSSSRRQFIKQVAVGSLLVIGGSDWASAAVRHGHPAKKASRKAKPHHPHVKAHSAKTGQSHHRSTHLSAKAAPAERHSDTSPARRIDTAHSRFGGQAHKSIALHNINTGERLNLTYFERGEYLKAAMDEINYLFRDHRTGYQHPVDPMLLDQLYDLKRLLDIGKPYAVVSGYRSPVTNAIKHSHSPGVAKHSLHMEGRAIDIRIEGLSTRYIRNAALAMQRGGVGYYPDANFVHLDTGEFRVW